jgi:hypothetical protein
MMMISKNRLRVCVCVIFINESAEQEGEECHGRKMTLKPPELKSVFRQNFRGGQTALTRGTLFQNTENNDNRVPLRH